MQEDLVMEERSPLKKDRNSLVVSQQQVQDGNPVGNPGTLFHC
jgi:hypothetical protein